ncbi:MAG: hypothetical protein CMO55_26690 [Verrucomicrobiales bacterium]|nr:hypothetical protein [Verrucomicrobiales bacterium]
MAKTPLRNTPLQISKIRNEGKIIHLSDSSAWAVDDTSVTISSTWQPDDWVFIVGPCMDIPVTRIFQITRFEDRQADSVIVALKR